MNRVSILVALMLVVLWQPARAAQRGAAGGVPEHAWAGIVHEISPLVQERSLSSPDLLQLQDVLANIDSRMAQDEAAGLESMDFIRFIPAKYQAKPEVFGGLDADKQVGTLARGVRAAGRALDSEAAELIARIGAGSPGASTVARLLGIYGKRFYLSSGVRGRVEEQVAELASAASPTDPVRTTIAKLKVLAENPLRGAAVFDNQRGIAAATTNEPPPAGEAAEPRTLRRNNLAPRRGARQDDGGDMKKKTVRRKAAPRKSADQIKDRIIKELGLQPLPGEGGYYRETYRSAIKVPVPLKEGEEPVVRNLGTEIYYLVTPDEFSALHRIKSDEMFHFYGGDPVEMLHISPTGESKKIIMGSNILKGQSVQVLVPAGTWQGTRLLKGGKYALLGTSVFPGFEFTDFEMGGRADLSAQFPGLKREIERFTRE